MENDKQTISRVYVPLKSPPKIYIILTCMLLVLMPCVVFYFIPEVIFSGAMAIPFLLLSIPIGFLSLMVVINGEKFEFSFDKTGIYENSSVASLGEIKWKQMVSFEVGKVSNIDAIVIRLTGNFIDQKIQQQRNIFRKWLMIITYNWIGYPVYILQGSLKWDIEFVVEIMRDYQNGIETEVVDIESI